jgi:hypothetical protein
LLDGERSPSGAGVGELIMDNPRSSSFLNPDEILVQEVSGSKIIGRDHIGKIANKQG